MGCNLGVRNTDIGLHGKPVRVKAGSHRILAADRELQAKINQLTDCTIKPSTGELTILHHHW